MARSRRTRGLTPPAVIWTKDETGIASTQQVKISAEIVVLGVAEADEETVGDIAGGLAVVAAGRVGSGAVGFCEAVFGPGDLCCLLVAVRSQ